MSSLDRRDVIQGAALIAALAAVSTVQQAQAAAGLFYVIAEIVAKPGSEAAVREILTNVAEKSRTTEPGCKLYTLLEVQKSPGRFLTCEIWVDRAALDAHMVTPHVKDAIPKLGDGMAPSSILAKPFTQLFLDPVSTA
jgi:quinol monooxygenase YgiN